MECPLCSRVFTGPLANDSYSVHVMFEHTDLFLFMAHTYYPDAVPDAGTEAAAAGPDAGLWPEELDDDNPDVDNMTYEEIQNLCDLIGYVKKGIPNIADVSDVVVKDGDAGRCPICLETMNENTVIRRLFKCAHMYCHGCIEKWLSCHVNCPLCQVDVRDAGSCSDAAVAGDAAAGQTDISIREDGHMP